MTKDDTKTPSAPPVDPPKAPEAPAPVPTPIIIQQAPPPALVAPIKGADHTREGGYYIVNGRAVDANGNPPKEDRA